MWVLNVRLIKGDPRLVARGGMGWGGVGFKLQVDQMASQINTHESKSRDDRTRKTQKCIIELAILHDKT